MSTTDPLRHSRLGVVRFAEEDLARIYDPKTIVRARQLILLGAVELVVGSAPITAVVKDGGRDITVGVTPMKFGQKTLFDRSCTCGRSVCSHTAAAALLTLDTQPEWRRPVQASLPGLPQTPADRADAALLRPAAVRPAPTAAPAAAARVSEERVALWTIEPGAADAVMYVTAGLAKIGRDGKPDKDSILPATPLQVLERTSRTMQGDVDRAIARLLGSGGTVRTAIPKDKKHLVDQALKRLLPSGRLRWRDGTPLVDAPLRLVQTVRDQMSGKLRPVGMPEGATLIRGEGWWYVDPKAGTLARAEMRQAPTHGRAPARPPSRPVPTKAAPPPRPTPPSRSETPEIIERAPRIILRLGRVATTTAGVTNALHLIFDYGDAATPAEIEADDQRQFAKIAAPDGAVIFVRRDKMAEQSILQRLANFGFVQFRIGGNGDDREPKGLRLHALHGKDAAEQWHQFVTTGLPELEAQGCEIVRDADFGIRVIEPDRPLELGIADSGEGWFDIDLGVEIDGVRRDLIPILSRLLEAGGMDAARIIDGKVHTVLDDGRALALPADRIAQLMSVLEGMLAAGEQIGDKLRVPIDEADALLDIDELVARRGTSAKVDSYLARLRDDESLPEMDAPALFQGELRPYQRQGLAWLQRLRANGLSGCLGDDMGLGKTAQTIAHIILEHQEGRLADPALVVVPTSLVPNWAAELARFAPHLRLVIMHGLERHERWETVAAAQVVVTTYAILARDLAAMTAQHWSLVVLDEAQAIKNPDAKATRAACSLDSNQRLCLSGTPVENNLGELWAQFAFLMPGLLGDRKSFQKRYRTPIEKRGDGIRAAQFSRRIRPFLLRRTKAEVASDLPPKTEVVRRVELADAERNLYEAIRLSVNEKVRAAIAATSLARSRITVLDALLKLRQVCCDPRLVKLEAARQVTESTKLAALVEMLQEMVPEGRRVLVFSQFTSMLDLIKPELAAASIDYVELTGSTHDRETPVRRFQAGEVPVFLLSLKAGGRGLNLTAADTVIHYDPWWNPAAEAQATDRAHRIGQDKPVFVYKLIAEGTVEDKILELQRRKTSLADAVINGGDLAGALGDEDLDYLLAPVEGEPIKSL
jgi:superfamily II DNA or RNA helicase